MLRSFDGASSTTAPAGLLMFAAAASSIAITGGIVGDLAVRVGARSSRMCRCGSSSPTRCGRRRVFAESAAFGILPLVRGTLVTTVVALGIALPVGTIVAIYLSEFAPVSVREVIKPMLELLERGADGHLRLLRAAVSSHRCCRTSFPACRCSTC